MRTASCRGALPCRCQQDCTSMSSSATVDECPLDFSHGDETAASEHGTALRGCECVCLRQAHYELLQLRLFAPFDEDIAQTCLVLPMHVPSTAAAAADCAAGWYAMLAKLTSGVAYDQVLKGHLNVGLHTVA